MSDDINAAADAAAAEPGASTSTFTSTPTPAVSSPSVTSDASQGINHDTATSTPTTTTTTTIEHTNGHSNHNHTSTDSTTSKTVDGDVQTPATSTTDSTTSTTSTPTPTPTPTPVSSTTPSISTSTVPFTSPSPSPSPTTPTPFSTFASAPAPSPGIPSRNLYVNHIPPISEPAFTQLFASHGPIERIRLFPAAGTMGYGFVMYARVEDAQKAVNAMNGFVIGGHPIHVSYKTESKKPPPPSVLPVMNSTSTNVYLANIPLHWTKIELDECCSVFGRIMESRVMMNLSTNTSRGIAFVRYEKVSEAALCIKSLHGVTLSGATPVIAKIADDKISARQPQVMASRVTATPYTKPITTTTSSYGPIKHTTASTYRYNPMQSTTTTAYQPYSTPSYTPAAQSSVPTYQPYTSPASQAYSPYTSHTSTPPPPPAQPSTPYVSPYQAYTTPTPPAPVRTVPPPTPPSLVAAAAAAATASGEEGFALFVFHLPPNVTETELTQLFSPYGKLTKVSIIRDLSSGTSKGYGFVNMAKKEEAEQAVLYLDGFALGSKHISVSFKK